MLIRFISHVENSDITLSYLGVKDPTLVDKLCTEGYKEFEEAAAFLKDVERERQYCLGIVGGDLTKVI